ncbi:hypothetical protein [Micrococcus terreus]|nr:hypothetical protein [Micrococcus terreus]
MRSFRFPHRRDPAPTSSARRAARRRLRARLDATRLGAQDPALPPDDGPSPPPRRRRMAWAGVAALPLIAAIALGLSPAPQSPASSPSVPSALGAAGPSASPSASGAAVPWTADPPAAWSPQAQAEPGAAASGSPNRMPVPAAPFGHRLVPVRVMDPAAVELLDVGDRMDVVGIDGQVITSAVSVLQIRDRAMPPVVVIAVPEQDGASVAAAVAATEVTVVLSPRTDPSAEDAAPAATGPAR